MARFGSGVVDVGVAISLQNNFSNQAKVIAQDYRSLMGELGAQSSYTNNTVGAIGSQLSQMIQGMYQVYDYSVGVQREIWMTSKIAGATAQQQSDMMQLAKDINEQTPLSASDVASAMRYLSMAGFKTDEIKAMIGPASQLATILGTPVGGKGGVADMMTNIMTTFNIPMSQTVSTVDDLYTAVTNANISLEDLADSIKYSGADAKNAGLSLRQLSAAIGVLGNAGIQGSMAGTAIGNMLRYMQLSASGARPKANDWLHKMGLDASSFYDAQGNLKNFDTVLVTMAEHMKDLSDSERTQAWNQIFQVRGSRGVSAMLDDILRNNSKYFQIMGLYEENQGVVGRVNQEFQQTPAGRLEAFKSSIENLVVTFGEAMTIMTPMITGLTKIIDLIQSFSQTGIGRLVSNFMVSATVVGLIRVGLLSIRRFLILITTSTAQVNTRIATANTGVRAMNAQWAGMEVHLMNILRMLGQMTVLQARMMGFGFNVGRSGRITLRDSKGRIRGNWGTSMGDMLVGNIAMAGAAGAAASAGAANATRAAMGGAAAAGIFGTTLSSTRVARGLLGMGVSKGVASGILRGIGAISGTVGKLLGPWGFVASIALPFIMDGISSLVDSSNKTAENTENSDENQKAYLQGALSPQFLKSLSNDPYGFALRGNIMGYGRAMAGALNPHYEVSLNINGRTIGPLTPGYNEYDVDEETAGLY